MWCGRLVVRWSCPVCGGKELRAPVIGSTRTAEELGRAFPGYRLIESSGEKVKESVGAQPAIVVATPGAEPLAEQGYAALIIMDAHLSLSRIDLRAGEEALRRWLNAIALVRPAREGGTVCLVGPSEDRVVQAVVRMDAAGFAQREWAERREAGFPPAVRFIEVDGEPEAVLEFLDAANLPESSQVLGPVEKTEGEQTYHRVLIRSPLSEANAATAALKAATGVRSARKSSGVVRVRVDPIVVS